MLYSSLGVLGCVLALALFLLWSGVRGWPKNARLLCNRCGYLLDGHVKPRVCPECGADLTRRRAIRVGERRKRKRVLFFGSIALIVALMMGVLLVSVVRNARINWNQMKPVWMLKREALAGTPAAVGGVGVVGSPALDELARRARYDHMSVSNLRSLAAFAMERQADLTTPFDRNWASIIEAAWVRGLLTPEQVNLFLKQAHVGFPHVTTAARMREGGRWRLQVSCDELRMAGGDGVLGVGTGTPGLFSQVTVRDASGTIVAEFLIDLPPKAAGKVIDVGLPLPVGTHALTIDCAAGLRWFDPNGDGTYTRREAPPIATWTATSAETVEIVPPGGAIVTSRPDESMRPAITAALVVDMVRPIVALSTGTFGGGGLVAIDRAPVAVSFDIFARAGGVEQRIGSLVGGKGSVAFTHVQPHPTPLFPEHTAVDIVLRTNVAHAEKWLTITEVWEGEIVIPNVPIPRMPNRGSPGSDAARRDP